MIQFLLSQCYKHYNAVQKRNNDTNVKNEIVKPRQQNLQLAHHSCKANTTLSITTIVYSVSTGAAEHFSKVGGMLLDLPFFLLLHSSFPISSPTKGYEKCYNLPQGDLTEKRILFVFEVKITIYWQ